MYVRWRASRAANLFGKTSLSRRLPAWLGPEVVFLLLTVAMPFPVVDADATLKECLRAQYSYDHLAKVPGQCKMSEEKLSTYILGAAAESGRDVQTVDLTSLSCLDAANLKIATGCTLVGDFVFNQGSDSLSCVTRCTDSDSVKETVKSLKKKKEKGSIDLNDSVFGTLNLKDSFTRAAYMPRGQKRKEESIHALESFVTTHNIEERGAPNKFRKWLDETQDSDAQWCTEYFLLRIFDGINSPFIPVDFTLHQQKMLDHLLKDKVDIDNLHKLWTHLKSSGSTKLDERTWIRVRAAHITQHIHAHRSTSLKEFYKSVTTGKEFESEMPPVTADDPSPPQCKMSDAAQQIIDIVLKKRPSRSLTAAVNEKLGEVMKECDETRYSVRLADCRGSSPPDTLFEASVNSLIQRGVTMDTVSSVVDNVSYQDASRLYQATGCLPFRVTHIGYDERTCMNIWAKLGFRANLLDGVLGDPRETFYHVGLAEINPHRFRAKFLEVVDLLAPELVPDVKDVVGKPGDIPTTKQFLCTHHLLLQFAQELGMYEVDFGIFQKDETLGKFLEEQMEANNMAEKVNEKAKAREAETDDPWISKRLARSEFKLEFLLSDEGHATRTRMYKVLQDFAGLDAEPLNGSVENLKCSRLTGNFVKTVSAATEEAVTAVELGEISFRYDCEDTQHECGSTTTPSLDKCRDGDLSEIYAATGAVRAANEVFARVRLAGITVNYMPHLFEKELRGIAVLSSVSKVLKSFLPVMTTPDLFVDVFLEKLKKKDDDTGKKKLRRLRKLTYVRKSPHSRPRLGPKVADKEAESDDRSTAPLAGILSRRRLAFRTRDHGCLAGIGALSKAIFNSLELVALESSARAAMQKKLETSLVGFFKKQFIGMLESIPLFGSIVTLVAGIAEGKTAELSAMLEVAFAELKAIFLDIELIFSAVDTAWETYAFDDGVPTLCGIIRLFCQSARDGRCRSSVKAIEDWAANTGREFKCPETSLAGGYAMDFTSVEKWGALFKSPLAPFTNPMPDSGKENVTGFL